MTEPRLAPAVASSKRVRAALDALREQYDVPAAFPPAAEAEAEAVARAWREVAAQLPAPTLTYVKLPAAAAQLPGPVPDRDARQIPFVTIDPAESRDLDQAVQLERTADGYQVRYAIACLATFIAPGGALDKAAHERATTIYAPDYSTPLHPRALSEDAASLLPDVDRPACLWTFQLDRTGQVQSAHVERALVRSRAKLSYVQVQEALDGRAALPAAAPADLPELLAEIGQLRLEREAERGGISLAVPEQETTKTNGGYQLVYRAALPVEDFNAQISLLTGMAAAQMMQDAGVGVLRTLPAAQGRDIARLRRTARALGLAWPRNGDYPAFVRALTGQDAAEAAFLNAATTLFRGGGYAAFDEQADLPLPPEVAGGHAAIAAPYAHVTAPLRRLVDRYGLEVCLAHCAQTEVPQWVRQALPALPDAMTSARRRASAITRSAVEALEALVLDSYVGRELQGVVVDTTRSERHGPGVQVQVADPAVIIFADGQADLGDTVRVRIQAVDVVAHKVQADVVGVRAADPAQAGQ
ncbi:RNB domain-containing ribonuclease [Buchananella hordeovulneris]|uniref:RNB domain-containing ribonuclease n=1 Tax=Buchananella hordeovulneris TaxID=52770 RepID=UPI0026DCDE62|nr:RNB domain-containing ribonuclease [Buchananella hordeovulneris]MDO5080635.1 RNB domain-containing ribonuclease [Buchananella hordeovulneris]